MILTYVEIVIIISSIVGAIILVAFISRLIRNSKGESAQDDNINSLSYDDNSGLDYGDSLLEDDNSDSELLQLIESGNDINYDILHELARDYFINKGITKEVIDDHYKKNGEKYVLTNLFIILYMDDIRYFWYPDNKYDDIISQFADIGTYDRGRYSLYYNKRHENKIDEMKNMNDSDFTYNLGLGLGYLCPWGRDNIYSEKFSIFMGITQTKIGCQFYINNKILYGYVCYNPKPEKIIEFYYRNILQYLRLHYISDNISISIIGNDGKSIIRISDMAPIDINSNIKLLKETYAAAII